MDAQGVISYVADRCRHVTHLHLKLFSRGLVVVDEVARQSRLNEDTDGAGGQYALREETQTTLLDSLLTSLPHVHDLTLSIAHEDIQPEVVWCASTASNLRKLTVNGGLKAMNYIMRKNRRCDLRLLMRIARECTFLESLSVAWDAPELPSSEQELSRMVEMFEALEGFTPASIHRNSSTNSVGRAANAISFGEQVSSLKWLRFDHCELNDMPLEIVFWSCPNLREVDFDSVKVAPDSLHHHINLMAQACPLLRSFKFQNPTGKAGDAYASSLMDGPLLRFSTLTLCLGNQADNVLRGIDHNWGSAHSITVLNIIDVANYDLLFRIMTTMTGLSHLTLGGGLSGLTGNGYSTVESYYLHDMSEGLRLPDFACKDSLQFLDVTRLEFCSLKCHELFFKRVQDMSRLKRLEISFRQLQDARLEETWSDPDEDPNILARSDFYPDKLFDPRSIQQRRRESFDDFGLAYVMPKDNDRGPEGEWRSPYYNSVHWLDNTLYHGQEAPDENERLGKTFAEASARATDKIFVTFPAVEFLYVLDDQPDLRNFWKYEHYISEHMASAVVRMMPKLKVLAFDRAL
ncbi:hypothetical protein BGZ98_000832, partial [Dissophora globulifera]